VGLLALRPVTQAVPGHHVDDLDPAAQPVHAVAVQPVKFPRPESDLGTELDQCALARTDLRRGGVQRVGLAALEEVDLVRADHGQLKAGERVR
jgi:hypothetical protein